jgi:UbiD family decarboxylase
VLPHERRIEGPFGEYMGYEAGKSSPKPILKITAITYRNSPILPFSNMGMPVHEGQTATALIKGAEIYAELRNLGYPSKEYSVLRSGLATCASCQLKFRSSTSPGASRMLFGRPNRIVCLLHRGRRD